MIFRRSHLRRRRSLLCEYSTSVSVIFFNIITEFRTSFGLLIFWFQFSIFQVTSFHHWIKVDFSFVSLRLQDVLFLASNLSWIDWLCHFDLFFSCQRFICVLTPNPGSYRMRIHTFFRNIVSLSLTKALSVGTDLQLLPLDFGYGICSETLSDALSW